MSHNFWGALSVVTVVLVSLMAMRYQYFKARVRERYEWRSVQRGKKAGNIYFYRPRYCPPFVIKTGRADDPKSRLLAQRTGHPFGTEVLGIFITKDDNRIEPLIHDDLSFWRISPDNEWFWIVPFIHPIWWYLFALRDTNLTKQVNQAIMIRLSFKL